MSLVLVVALSPALAASTEAQASALTEELRGSGPVGQGISPGAFRLARAPSNIISEPPRPSDESRCGLAFVRLLMHAEGTIAADGALLPRCLWCVLVGPCLSTYVAPAVQLLPNGTNPNAARPNKTTDDWPWHDTDGTYVD